MKTKKGLVHAVAICKDCNFREEDYLHQAQRKAQQHFKKTGHTINIDLGYVCKYTKED